MVTITVYKSYDMSVLLDEWEFDDDDIPEIEPIQRDYRDGSDWWVEFLDDVEDQFGSDWIFAKFSSNYNDDNRLISRQYYLGGDEIDWSQFFKPTAILIAKETVENFSSMFSAHKYVEHTLNIFSLSREFQMPYSNTDLLSKIIEFERLTNNYQPISSLYEDRKVWYEVSQPNENSLFAAKLSSSFEVIVNFNNLSSAKIFFDEIYKLDALDNARGKLGVIQADLQSQGIASSSLGISLNQIALEFDDCKDKITYDFFYRY